jgi:hypothetical protein
MDCVCLGPLIKPFSYVGKNRKSTFIPNMRRLLTGYVINFNRRHKRYGHLFQNRYKSIICEDDPYLLDLTRYIHLNPLRAGIVANKKDLDTYPWTGHSAIIGKLKREWQDSDTILAYFGRTKREAIGGYNRFVAQGITQGKRKELVGGGLIRSLGGWSQVVSLRRKGEQVASDQRILGSSAIFFDPTNAIYYVHGLGKNTYNVFKMISPTDDYWKALETWSWNGDGPCVVYFDNVWVLR